MNKNYGEIIKKHWLSSLIICLAVTVFAGTFFFVHGASQTTPSPAPTGALSPTPTPLPKTLRATLKTSLGDIELELNAEKAPVTVQNFLQYIESGFYKDTLFHRLSQ